MTNDKIIELVAHLGRSVLRAKAMRVFVEADGVLMNTVSTGCPNVDPVAIGMGIVGQVFKRNQVFYAASEQMADGELAAFEREWKSLGVVPITVPNSGSVPIGVFWLAYAEVLVPTQDGRINLVSFGTALYRLMVDDDSGVPIIAVGE